MSLTLDQLREEVLALTPEQRRSLLDSVSETQEAALPGLHPGWAEELRFRSAEYRAGRMGGVSLEDFERELDESLQP